MACPFLVQPFTEREEIKMKTFTVNGVTYTAKPFTYNTVCDLEEMGISLQDMQNKPMSVVRAYFAICAGKGSDFAGEQIEAHVIAGGRFDEVIEAMSEEMDKSDFFRALQSRENNDLTPGTEEKSKKK